MFSARVTSRVEGALMSPEAMMSSVAVSMICSRSCPPDPRGRRCRRVSGRIGIFFEWLIGDTPACVPARQCRGCPPVEAAQDPHEGGHQHHSYDGGVHQDCDG